MSIRLPRILRFAIVGGFNTLSYALLAFLLTALFGWRALPASAIAFGFAAFLSYIGHKQFTFRSGGDHAREAPRFLTLTLCGYGVALAVPALCQVLGLPAAAAILATCVVIPVVNYVVMARAVFIDVAQQRQ